MTDYNPHRSESMNPYQAPTAMLDEPNEDSGELLDEPNRLPVGSGLTWITQGWELFMMRPSVWIISSVIYIVVAMGVSFIPVINILTGLFAMYFIVGFAYIAYQLEYGEDVGVGDLFVGFQYGTVKLLW